MKPYYFTFTTHAKGRWVGSKVIDVFSQEFQSETPEFYVSIHQSPPIRFLFYCFSGQQERAIKAGKITGMSKTSLMKVN